MEPIIKLKNKGQITLPTAIRQKAGLRSGDLFKVTIDQDKITLTPQSLTDKRLAQSMADFKAGRSYGPFNSMDAMLVDLHKRAKQKSASKK